MPRLTARGWPASCPWRVLGAYLAAGLSYGAIAVALSWPGAAHLTTRVIGNGGDTPQNLWNVAWVGGWLAGHHGLYRTHQLLAPTGANLAWMTLALPASILAAALRPLAGLTGAYNLAVLASLLADGLAAFAFARRLRLRGLGAWAAGAAFCSSPYFVGQMLGHLHLLGAYGIPLVLTLLWGLLERPAARLWRYVALGAVLALTCYAVEDYALYAVAACVVVLACHPATYRRGVRGFARDWWRWGVAAGTCLALTAPLVEALLAAPLAVHGNVGATPLRTPWVVDLRAFVTPEPWGLLRSLRPAWSLAPDLADGAGFPGYVVWLAVAVLLLGHRRLGPADRPALRLAAAGAAVFAVLSMGPYLHVGGVRLAVPLPDWVLAQLPGWRFTLPERLAVLTALFASLLVGVAVNLLLGWFAAWHPRWRWPAAALAVASLGLILLASAAWPYPDTALPRLIPVAAATLRASGGDVLFVPAVIPFTDYGTGPVTYMSLDAVIGRPTPEGYVSRLPQVTISRVNHSVALAFLWELAHLPDPCGAAHHRQTSALTRLIRGDGVSTIVLIDAELAHPAADEACLEALVPGTRPIRAGRGLQVLLVPRRAAATTLRP